MTLNESLQLSVRIYALTEGMSKNLVCAILQPYPTIPLPFPNINSGDSGGGGGGGGGDELLHCFLLRTITSNLNPRLLIQPPTDTHAADTPTTFTHVSSKAGFTCNPLLLAVCWFHMPLNCTATKGALLPSTTLLTF